MRALLPSRTAARYVGGMFLRRTAFVLAGLLAVLLTLDTLGEAGKILEVPGNSEADVWRYTALRLPQLISQFLPFSVLLATLLTLSELASGSEIVIFKASGISAHQILAPLFAVALGVALLSFAFNELVLTQTNAKLKAWKAADYADYSELQARTPQQVWLRDGVDLIHAEALTGRGAEGRLTGVILYDRDGAGALVRTVRAASAVPAPGGWRMEGATLFNVATGARSGPVTYLWRSGTTPADIRLRDPDPDALAWWQLGPAIREVREQGRSTDALNAALHHKLSGPLSSVMMPLLGAVAGFGLARSGRLFVRAVAGMVLGFTFFVADNFMLAMGSLGAVPPLIAAWSPLVLFFLLGEALLLHTEE